MLPNAQKSAVGNPLTAVRGASSSLAGNRYFSMRSRALLSAMVGMAGGRFLHIWQHEAPGYARRGADGSMQTGYSSAKRVNFSEKLTINSKTIAT
jgi:hypothetical protein